MKLNKEVVKKRWDLQIHWQICFDLRMNEKACLMIADDFMRDLKGLVVDSKTGYMEYWMGIKWKENISINVDKKGDVDE